MRNLWPLAIILIALLVLQAMLAPALFIIGWLAPELAAQWMATQARQIDAIELGLRLIVIIAFAIWIIEAGKNLQRVETPGLMFSPASRVWWFAVPLANLVQPYLGMRELYNASLGADEYEQNQPVLIGWWASHVLLGISSFVARAGGPLADSGNVFLVQLGLLLADTACAIVIVWRTTTAQASYTFYEEAAEVFD